MNLSSNTTTFATKENVIDPVEIPASTAINTYTKIVTGSTNADAVTNILVRSGSAATTTFRFIMCPTGSQTTSKYWANTFQVAANAGNNGTTAIASLAAIIPDVFRLDLAGNRVIILEPGQEIWVMNTAATGAGGPIVFTPIKMAF